MIITEELKSKIADLARKHKLSLVVLFGSQATGKTHKFSDIDIGYLAKERINYEELYNITIELCKIFKNKNVEFVNINNISPAHKKQISDNGILLFEKDSIIFDLYKVNALREYIDTKSLRRYQEMYISNFLEKYA